ncbi:hypothetical protein D3C85_1156400 [compost metagenome]
MSGASPEAIHTFSFSDSCALGRETNSTSRPIFFVSSMTYLIIGLLPRFCPSGALARSHKVTRIFAGFSGSLLGAAVLLPLGEVVVVLAPSSLLEQATKKPESMSITVMLPNTPFLNTFTILLPP